MTKRYRLVVFGIFILLFIYLVLRAWYVEPLKDELLTYFNFIEHGNILDDEIVFDEANNHLLNSFTAHFLNNFDNGNYFLLRLPNLLAFPLFFFAVVKLLSGLGNQWQRTIALLSIVCVPFYLEYFAACRGYGMGLAFLTWTIYFTHQWLKTPKTGILVLAYVSAWLSAFSVLNYISSALIFAVILIAGQLIIASRGKLAILPLRGNIATGKQDQAYFSIGKHLLNVLIHLLFLASLLPLIELATTLRKAGALYYGSLDGFWLVTAKSVLRYTIFYDANWLKYFSGLLFAVISVIMLRKLFRHTLQNFLRLTETVPFILLTGNIVVIFILAKIMKVNYPEDRVAMHLAFLTLLLSAIIVLRSRISNLIVLFSFFPVVFLLKANLDSSVISPDDRLSTGIYETVRNQSAPGTTLAGYHTIPPMWSWMERQQGGSHLDMQSTASFPLYHDFVITRADQPGKPAANKKNYTRIAYHEPSMFAVWKRNSPARKILTQRISSGFAPSDNEYLQLCSVQITDSLREFPQLIRAKFDLKLTEPCREVVLVFTTLDSNGAAVFYEQVYLDWSYRSDSRSFPVDQSFIFEKLRETEREIRVYVWNRKRSKMYFYNGQTEIYKILP